MKLCLDPTGKLDYEALAPEDTVQDLLDAVDVFLNAHPLPCFDCAESCCRKAWAVEVDNVFVRRHAGEGEAAGRFVRERLKLKFNGPMEFNQYVLNKKTDCDFILPDNHCKVYGIRPVICRLYVCVPRGRRYDLVRGLVAATYLQALVMEEKLRHGGQKPETERRYRRNPALFAGDYSLKLMDILSYSERMGWLESEDFQGLL